MDDMGPNPQLGPNFGILHRKWRLFGGHSMNFVDALLTRLVMKRIGEHRDVEITLILRSQKMMLNSFKCRLQLNGG